eukprot:CAMPEP_0194439346 /NCGR_PEP_ID=MMETSP0176-20130528/110041_1 /TAXON_ID=216777 /ORGANISM="Proboscia alata, Strain PI-D3" /LENGTH=218 /DNA_ID=CAMNT_0039262461 /DNA_START=17 /DNA_END=669 /DNA_ORIENTATION=+
MKLFPVSSNSGDIFTDDTTLRENTTFEDGRQVVHNMLSGKVLLQEDVLASYAADEVESLFKNSALINEDAEGRITRFGKEELFPGRTLGKGGYSTVREVYAVNLSHSKSEEGGTNHFGTVLRRSNCKKKSLTCLKKKALKGKKVTSAPMEDKYDDDIFDWNENDMVDQIHDRNSIAKHCMRGGKSRYAIKKLHSSFDENPKQHFNGIIDLAVEARFLA